MDDALTLELKELESERKHNTEALKVQQQKYANLLLSSMGDDMMDVLNGKIQVTLSEAEIKANKSKRFWQKIQNFFKKWG